MAIVAVVEDKKKDMRFRKRTGSDVNIQQPFYPMQQVKRVLLVSTIKRDNYEQ